MFTNHAMIRMSSSKTSLPRGSSLRTAQFGVAVQRPSRLSATNTRVYVWHAHAHAQLQGPCQSDREVPVCDCYSKTAKSYGCVLTLPIKGAGGGHRAAEGTPKRHPTAISPCRHALLSLLPRLRDTAVPTGISAFETMMRAIFSRARLPPVVRQQAAGVRSGVIFLPSSEDLTI